MKRFYGALEGAILVIIGTGITCFALSENYELLMNAKFRPLTVIGSMLLVVLGIAALARRPKSGSINSLVFVAMFAVVVAGDAYLPPSGMSPAVDPGLEAGLWEQVDLAQFPRVDLQELCGGDADKIHAAGGAFTAVGVVKRLEALESRSSFALMTSFMYCCLADAVAVGIRVEVEDMASIEDGQTIMISGRIAPEPAPMDLPNFRFGRAMISRVTKNYYVVPEKIMSYNWLDQLPPLTEEIVGPNRERFKDALKRTSLWEALEGKGPYTVLVPVDSAIEAMEGPGPEEMEREAMELFLKGHIIQGSYSIGELAETGSVESLAGTKIDIVMINGKPRVNGSRVLFRDLRAKNGIVHFIYPALAPAAEGEDQ